jgi:hypothetical protein
MKLSFGVFQSSMKNPTLRTYIFVPTAQSTNSRAVSLVDNLSASKARFKPCIRNAASSLKINAFYIVKNV